MKRNLLFACVNIIFFSISFAQKVDVVNNEVGYFESVFKNAKSGTFNGTINGVLFINDSNGKSLILDFQGSISSLGMTEDQDEVYDVSSKNYTGYTTSGKTKVEYQTYAMANRLIITLSSGTFQAGIIDGACDVLIKGLNYYYKAEKDTEYLILRAEEPIKMTNFFSLPDNNESKEQKIYLQPNSTLVFAIKR
ncbi:MAG: hypothetical protein ACK5M3_07180 [Dysgonomonas sp.]